MPKSLIKPKEEIASDTVRSVSSPEMQLPVAEPPAAVVPARRLSATVDVSLILALYKKCIEGGYQHCEVLKNMAVDMVKERLKTVIEAELAHLIGPEFRGEIGQICIEV